MRNLVSMWTRIYPICKAIEDPKWFSDFDRVFCLFRGLCTVASNGLLSQWCREVILESLNNWSELAAAAMLVCKQHSFRLVSGQRTTTEIRETARTIISRVLTFISIFISDQLITTSNAQLPIVWNSVGRILLIYQALYCESYVANCKGTPRISTQDDEEVLTTDVELLLKMLDAISDCDLLDFSDETSFQNGSYSDSGASSTRASEMILEGFKLVFPFITEELLQHENIGEFFFQFLNKLVQTVPLKVASLDRALFSAIFDTLKVGTKDARVLIARRAFEGLQTLAEFHSVEVANNRVGLGNNATMVGSNSKSIFFNLIEHFIFGVILEPFDTTLLNTMANSMLAIILCISNPEDSALNLFSPLQVSKHQHDALDSAFRSLLQSNNLHLSLDRVNKRRFQDNFVVFVHATRLCLRTR